VAATINSFILAGLDTVQTLGVAISNSIFHYLWKLSICDCQMVE
jgi:hypothetical protein